MAYGNSDGMKLRIDKAGRVVVPKSLREGQRRMDRRENLRRSAGALRGKMCGRTNLHVQSRGFQAAGAARSATENVCAMRFFATHLLAKCAKQISQILRKLSRMTVRIFSGQDFRSSIVVTYCIRVICVIRGSIRFGSWV